VLVDGVMSAAEPVLQRRELLDTKGKRTCLFFLYEWDYL
jgi:hypothetical protein